MIFKQKHYKEIDLDTLMTSNYHLINKSIKILMEEDSYRMYLLKGKNL